MLNKRTQSPLLLGLFLALAILAAWSNSYQAPLAFDDLGSISDNPSIRPPYHLNSLLNPPSDGAQTVAGRPLLNLSFAANYAFSGENYTTYRVTNVLIHIGNSLLVFALATQLLSLASAKDPDRPKHLLSFFISLLWAVHPTSTTAVSYLVQRAESLTAFFILLTLYGFARSIDSKRNALWLTLSLCSAFIGSVCKETMVTAPFLVALMAWIYLPAKSDRPQGSRARFGLPLYFVLLFISILPTVLLSYGTGDRAGTASISIGPESFDYLKLQTLAISRYLRLAIWPVGQVFDYGRDIEVPPVWIWLSSGLLILSLLGIATYLCSQKCPLGFLALSPFLLLAPSSSIFPLTDPIFEHRFYLPLAFLIAILASTLFRYVQRVSLLVLPALAVALAFATYARNQTYQSDIELWESSLRYSPNNARAQTNLGTLLLAKDHKDAALKHLKKAVEIRSTPLRLHNLANAYALSGEPEKAVPLYEEALASQPKFPAATLGLAEAQLALNKHAEAAQRFRQFLEGNPNNLSALRGYARACAGLQNFQSAAETYQKICQIQPESAAAYFDLGDIYAQSQNFKKSKAAFLRSTELDPSYAQAHANLGNIYLMEKDYFQAITSYQEAIRLQPSAMVHTNLAICLVYAKRIQDAKTHLEKAIELDPNYPPARNILRQLRGH